MEHKTHDDWAAITSLGGPSKVADLLGWSVQRVQNWKIRGIPSSVKLKRPDLFLRQFQKRRKKAKAA